MPEDNKMSVDYEKAIGLITRIGVDCSFKPEQRILIYNICKALTKLQELEGVEQQLNDVNALQKSRADTIVALNGRIKELESIDCELLDEKIETFKQLAEKNAEIKGLKNYIKALNKGGMMNIEELKESVYHTDITRDEICEIIDQAVEITKREREWISVDDRLPPENKYVLINVMMIAMYDREYKQWDDGDYYHDIEDVTHWMLLPESPKEV